MPPIDSLYWQLKRSDDDLNELLLRFDFELPVFLLLLGAHPEYMDRLLEGGDIPTLRAAARPYICVIPPNLPAFPTISGCAGKTIANISETTVTAADCIAPQWFIVLT
jgi:hypothetical protein